MQQQFKWLSDSNITYIIFFRLKEKENGMIEIENTVKQKIKDTSW